MNKFKMKTIVLLSLFLFTFNSLATISCTPSSADYSYNTNQDPTLEKVQSNGRVYFFSLPKNECKISTFLINNDKLLKYREENRAYFYSAPNNECRRDDFVIFKDSLVVLDKGKNFSYAVYLDTNSKITNGFIKNENLSKVELISCINENDFTVNIHNLSFKLNEPISKVKSDILASTGQEPSLFYIGQNDDGITSFALDYKYNDQVFIYLSALNSDVYNIDEETITQMTFNISNQFTSRGIGIGSHFNDVIQKYGHCGVIEQNSGNTEITYSYFDKSLVFTIKEDRVIDINYLTLPWDQIRF